ncbi:unnamed protein product [Spirodela intermedia]|uniref:Biotin carboxyl carrier protein of acetyl-CoA carboxylase n=1 Tax=Spirodela intermedia TaxID=51605 RepID=A0A7I8KEI4_SPIIN|nr:unnamed protein product [Spirodela intermedia]
MASASVPAAFAAASSVVTGADISSSTPPRCSRASGVSLRLARRPKLALISSKVVGGLSNDSIAVDLKPKLPEGDSAEPSAKGAVAAPMSEEAVSEFLNQVSSLIRLVDSRDIVELQLKQQDCELVIRKKEALPIPPAPNPVVMMQPQGTSPVLQQQFAPLPPVAQPQASSGASPSPPSSPAAANSSAKSSHPPLKSPMAGTFYRSPGPGQAPFVKVGDKVNKGQVLCIIEAMKLMNEIEADQAGTVVEILADDAKPVGIEQPLFVIEP